MKTRYVRLMELSLSAYTDDHIQRYFREVRERGLTEHGFPRLTANIGILIAHRVREDLKPLFREMMDFCCAAIPRVKAANDFSVREIVCCLSELEAKAVFPIADLNRWKADLASIVPETCYNCYAASPDSQVRNWALFSAVSEYFRQDAGLCDSADFIDLQLEVQLKWLDQNGMYCDHAGAYPHQPIMYDLVSRGLFALLLHRGYRGKHYAAIDGALRRAGLATLKSQSVTGEMPFGGRSNQFIHNEGWLAAVLEYEANRYAAEGNTALSNTFKNAAARAVESAVAWLAKTPIRHVKNRFPTESRYGCEGYAYFDKYMITTASNFYAAYLICDGALPAEAVGDGDTAAFMTSDRFHKLFLKQGDYGLEFDLNADPRYDASGLGRVHRRGAPSAICLSMPCPLDPAFTLDLPGRIALSLCPARRDDDGWRFAADGKTRYEVSELNEAPDAVSATLRCIFPEGNAATLCYTVTPEGVTIRQYGDGEMAHAIPAFAFDGETSSAITVGASALTVAYDGAICRYETDGTLQDTGLVAANRNGHYCAYVAIAPDILTIRITITPRP